MGREDRGVTRKKVRLWIFSRIHTCMATYEGLMLSLIYIYIYSEVGGRECQEVIEGLRRLWELVKKI